MSKVKDMVFRFHTGRDFHMLGLGTYQIRGEQLLKQVIDDALSLGYRCFDTAYVYRNEEDLGKCFKELLPKHNLTRQDIQIVSKLPPGTNATQVQEILKESLTNLQTDYLDVYLIHWPGTSGRSVKVSANKFREDIWAEFTKAKQQGLVKDIGVSNFSVNHLTELLSGPNVEKPVLNQVEYHPYTQSDDLQQYCNKQGILLQAYSSLGGTNNKELMSDPVITDIAQKLNKQPVQVLLRWALQKNIAIIPKARSKDHLRANIELDFTIPDDMMQKITNLKIKTTRYAWDPTTVD